MKLRTFDKFRHRAIFACLAAVLVTMSAAVGGFFAHRPNTAFARRSAQSRTLEASVYAPSGFTRIPRVDALTAFENGAIAVSGGDAFMFDADGAHLGVIEGEFSQAAYWYGFALLTAADGTFFAYDLSDLSTGTASEVVQIASQAAPRSIAVYATDDPDKTARLYRLYDDRLDTTTLTVSATMTEGAHAFRRGDKTLYLSVTDGASIPHAIKGAAHVAVNHSERIYVSTNLDTGAIYTYNSEDNWQDLFGGNNYDPVRAIAAVNNGLVYTTDIKLISVTENGGFLHETPYQSALSVTGGRLVSPTAVASSADGSSILVSDTFNAAAYIQRFSTDLSFISNLIIASDAAQGRFHIPFDLTAGADGIYVSDKNNNRVVTLGGTGFPARYERPSAIAVDYDGRTAVVDQNDTCVTIASATFSRQYTGFTRVSDVAFTGDNALYIADAGAKTIMKIGADEKVVKFADFEAKRIAANTESNCVFAIGTDETIAILDGDGVAVLALNGMPSAVTDIAADAARNLYLLGGDTIYRAELTDNAYTVTHEFQLTTADVAAPIGTLTSVVVNAQYTDGYGDLFVTDTYGCVRRVDGKAASVAVQIFDENFQDEIDYSTQAPIADRRDAAVYSFKDTQVSLYRFPNVSERIAYANGGTQTIVLKLNLAANEFFSQVLVEFDTPVDVGGKPTRLVNCYVMKSSLSAPRDVTSYPYTRAKILNDRTKVYKYPSLYAPLVKQGDAETTLAKDTEIDTLPYAYPYTDVGGSKWVAVNLDDGVGFILASNMTERNFSAVTQRPRSNATVTTDSALGIPVYHKTANGYEQIEYIYIPNDTRVHVPDKYSSRAEYTRILYVHDDLGMLDCYVKTQSIRSDELSVVQALAIVIIIVTVVAGVVVFFVRRKNLYNEPRNQ